MMLTPLTFAIAAFLGGPPGMPPTQTPAPTPTPTPAQTTAASAAARRDEQITVTANRIPARVSETAASVAMVSGADLAVTAAATLDDALRQTPGFSLFRRTGSRAANPTAQGVSLRGLGASGASRAAVLSDGVPFNDPFGGWVYWGRTPRAAIDRVEIVRGGASSLYGTDALGGVINLVSRKATAPVLNIDVSWGAERSPLLSLFAGGRRGKWGVQASGEHFQTDGYVLVDVAQRGPVDTKAGVSYSSADLTIDRVTASGDRLFLRGSLFDESRRNGTPLQTNGTWLRQLAAGGDWITRPLGTVTLRGYIGSQVFDQDFSAVTADRRSEALTRRQRTPARHGGVSSQIARGLGARHALVGGLEFREVQGDSDEIGFGGGRATLTALSGGRERITAIYAQDVIALSTRLIGTLGGRFDRWENSRGRSVTTNFATSLTSFVAFPSRVETAFSPRLSLLYKVGPTLSLTTSGYRAFRAPTLNELYRSFRVGNVLTQANAALQAERLTGGEAGLRFASREGRFRASGSAFWSDISRPVANVTLSSTPALVTRERRNLGRTRSRGLELEAESRLLESFSMTLGYLFVDPRVTSFPVNPALEGLLLPQVARHQFTFQTRYTHRSSFTVAVQGRAAGAPFDDDQNLLPLDRLFVVDAFASRAVSRNVEAFAAMENVLDARYQVGRSGVTTIGAPRLARVGLRLKFGPP